MSHIAVELEFNHDTLEVDFDALRAAVQTRCAEAIARHTSPGRQPLSLKVGVAGGGPSLGRTALLAWRHSGRVLLLSLLLSAAILGGMYRATVEGRRGDYVAYMGVTAGLLGIINAWVVWWHLRRPATLEVRSKRFAAVGEYGERVPTVAEMRAALSRVMRTAVVAYEAELCDRVLRETLSKSRTSSEMPMQEAMDALARFRAGAAY
jgi:hypothetical protein